MAGRHRLPVSSSNGQVPCILYHDFQSVRAGLLKGLHVEQKGTEQLGLPKGILTPTPGCQPTCALDILASKLGLEVSHQAAPLFPTVLPIRTPLPHEEARTLGFTLVYPKFRGLSASIHAKQLPPPSWILRLTVSASSFPALSGLHSHGSTEIPVVWRILLRLQGKSLLLKVCVQVLLLPMSPNPLRPGSNVTSTCKSSRLFLQFK